MTSMDSFNQWYQSGLLTDNEMETMDDLKATRNNLIEEHFYKNLEFGTGGLRGIIGLGTNRINRFTVRRATQGIANYLNANILNKEIKAVIAYDTRHYSKDFALETALVFAANGIKVYLFSEETPTPILSFGVRYLNADVGVVITASHNPKNYNGYKVYNNLGGQVTLDMATSLQKEINALDVFKDVKTIDFESAIFNGQLEYIDQLIFDAYDKLLLEHSFKKPEHSNLKVIYTPIHGSGLNPVVRLLKKKGYAFDLVDAQSTMDGDFPTVIYPNPEEKEALKLAVELAEKKDADIVLGTDPDADRVGVVVKHQGTMHYLNGNEIGVLLLNFILSNRTNSDNDFIVKTIVTSDLGDVIAKDKGVGVINTLTGFKFIGEQIEKLLLNNENFIFGFEESYGYLKDTYVRDKDAVMSSIMITDMTAHYKSNNLTLVDVLELIYAKHGYYMNALDTLVFEGKEGISIMKHKLSTLKTQSKLISSIHPHAKLITIEDYTTSQRLDVIKDEYGKIMLPVSDVVKFIYSDGSWVVMRPSGTEPKLKIYYQAIGNDAKKSRHIQSHMKQSIQSILNS